MASPAKPAGTKDERAERLAAALRENLKRRKAQARAKEQTSESEEEDR
jgi:tripartite-type tricarboxylate transporter receptor subunit TctC